jgi:hypothetical protein
MRTSNPTIRYLRILFDEIPVLLVSQTGLCSIELVDLIRCYNNAFKAASLNNLIISQLNPTSG